MNGSKPLRDRPVRVLYIGNEHHVWYANFIPGTDVTRSDFLTSIKTIIKYHRSCGIGSYPGGDRICSSLLDVIPRSTGQEPLETVDTHGIRPGLTREEGSADPALSATSPIEELTRQVEVCTGCSLHQSRQIAIPGSGGSQPKLLVVGDWYQISEALQLRAGLVFGEEQEVMLEKMMTAIGLSREAVFVTNVIKCSVPGAIRPGAEHISVCINYLKQQIALLSPRLICAMGPVTAHTLLDTRTSLSQLRGRFHKCKLVAAQSIPVMPTYHPSYLLQNPEMKQAAWADLQMIQKELDKKESD